MKQKKTGAKAERIDAGFYRRLYQSMADPFVLVRMDGSIRDFNESYRAMLGYTADELRRLTYKDLTPAKWHAHEARIVRRQILPEKSSAVYEKEYRRKNGEVFPVELRTCLIVDAKGVAEGMWAIVRDISGRKREQAQLDTALAKLRDINQRLEFNIERMPIAHIVWDSDFRVVEWNPHAEKIFGWTARQAIGRHANELMVPQDMKAVVNVAWEDVMVRGNPSGRSVNENVTRDGRRIICEWFNGPICDDRGSILGCISMAHDITERAMLEQKMQEMNVGLEQRVTSRTHDLTQLVGVLQKEVRRRRRAERALLLRQRQLVELVSQLILAESAERRRIADGIHDDVNQMLAAAKLLTGHMSQNCPPGCRGKVKELEGIIDHVLSATRLLTFDLSSPVLHRLGLKAAVEDLCDRFRAAETIGVVFQGESGDRQMDDEVKDFAFRAVRELLSNIKRHASAKQVKVNLRWIKAGVELTVKDNGVGPGQIKKSLFSPVGGFGLYSIRERLEHLGGWMGVSKAGERGTRIALRIPTRVRARSLRMKPVSGGVTGSTSRG
jgi:PAS domain S-box-containing protein